MKKLLFLVMLLAGCAASKPIKPPVPDPTAYSVYDCAPKRIGDPVQCTPVIWPAQVPAGETCTAVPSTGGAYVIVCQ